MWPRQACPSCGDHWSEWTFRVRPCVFFECQRSQDAQSGRISSFSLHILKPSSAVLTMPFLPPSDWRGMLSWFSCVQGTYEWSLYLGSQRRQCLSETLNVKLGVSSYFWRICLSDPSSITKQTIESILIVYFSLYRFMYAVFWMVKL